MMRKIIAAASLAVLVACAGMNTIDTLQMTLDGVKNGYELMFCSAPENAKYCTPVYRKRVSAAVKLVQDAIAAYAANPDDPGGALLANAEKLTGDLMKLIAAIERGQ